MYYAGLVALGWAWGRVRSRAGASGPPTAGRSTARRTLLAVEVAVLAVTFLVTVKQIHPRLSDPESPLRWTLAAVDSVAASAGEEPVEIHTIDTEFDVVGLFRGPGSKPAVVWRRHDLAGLAEELDRGTPPLCLDVRRMRRSLRYLRGPAAELYAETLEEVETALALRYARRNPPGKYGVFVAAPHSLSLLRAPGTSSPDEEPGAPVRWQAGGRVRMEPTRRGGIALVGAPPGHHFYLSTGATGRFDEPPEPGHGLPVEPGAKYMVAIRLDLGPEVRAGAFVIQYDDRGRFRTDNHRLRSGLNHFELVTSPATRSVRLALRFATGEGPGGRPPRIEVADVLLRPASTTTRSGGATAPGR
jgi:hypothetical protein